MEKLCGIPNENKEPRSPHLERPADRLHPSCGGGGGGARPPAPPSLLFVVGVTLAAFFAGMYVQYSKIYPFPVIKSAYKTLVVNLDLSNQTSSADLIPFPLGRCSRNDSSLKKVRRDYNLPTLNCLVPSKGPRVKFIAADELDDSILMRGELGAFLDDCPLPHGCVGVKYSPPGVVSHVWPYRPEEIMAANIVSTSDYPYEHPLNWSFGNGTNHTYISPYFNHDLLVVFGLRNSSPYGGGIARLAPDGRPRWYRKDYSHHWPYVVDEDFILVPGQRLEQASISYAIAPGHTEKLTCQDVIRDDTIRIINGSGDLLEEISIIEELIRSRYASSLADASSPCDPIHLNFVHMLDKDAGEVSGDFVVSLRHLNAFGIIDHDTHQLKRLVRGSFRQQHGVRHLKKTQFLIFDNQGTDGTHGPSRLLMVDLATGKETTIFPNDHTPEPVRSWYVPIRGQFDVSPDKRRVLLADYPRGRGFEIRLSDGKILNTFLQIHDLQTLPGFPDALAKNAGIFALDSLHYANRWEQ